MPTASTPPRYTLGFDDQIWGDLTRLAGLTTEREQADAIGVSRGQLNRIRNRRAAPGPEFIAAVRATFPAVSVDRLFPVVVKAAA